MKIRHTTPNKRKEIINSFCETIDKVYLIDEQKLEQQQLLIEIHAVKSTAIELKTVSDQVQDKEPSNQSPYFAAMPSDAGFYAIDPDDDYLQTGTS